VVVVVVAKVRARFRRTSLLFRTAIATPTPKTASLSGLDIKTSARAGKKRISYVFLTDFFNFFSAGKWEKWWQSIFLQPQRGIYIGEVCRENARQNAPKRSPKMLSTPL
jgi:hypothetical protein